MALVFFFSRGKAKSRTDRIYVSPDVITKTYEHKIFSKSDHDLIKTRILFQSNSTRGKGIWKNKTKLYSEDDFGESFSVFWKSWLNENKVSHTCRWWLKTKSKIKKFLFYQGYFK